MPAHQPTTAGAEGTPPAPLERHGGWLISAALHVALFALLLAWQAPRALMPDRWREPVRVMLAEAPRAAATVAVATEATPEPSAATRARLEPMARTTPKAAPRVAMKEPEVIRARETAPKRAEVANALPLPPAQDKTARPDNLASSERDAAEKARIEQYQREAEALGRQTAEQGAAGSPEVARELISHSVRQKANEILFDSRGVEEGAIRELDVTGVPEEEAQKVLTRYGIRILAGYGQAPVATQGFLSGANTKGGRYTNMEQAGGPVEIFQYGPAAIQRMMELESIALREKGQTPATARIVRAVFGIAPTPQGYDLAIQRLEATALPPAQPAAR